MKKRILSLILALCALAALATVLSVTVFADDTPTYTFDNATGTLTIGGTGGVDGHGVRTAVGEGTLKAVIVEDGVTYIEDNSFPDQTALESLSIFGALDILDEAFLGCTKLTSAYFFDDAILFWDYSFKNCSSDLKFYGYTGSTAETYANSYGITFVPIPFKVTGGTLGKDYTYDVAGGVLTVLTATPLTIANDDPITPTSHRIVVASGISANITLAGVNIENSSASPFEIAANSEGDVTITLADDTTNTLKATNYSWYAALQKEGDGADIGKLTIQGETAGTGKLFAESYSGAGIGGNSTDSSTAAVSNITISGGMVTAKSTYGAGIGSGSALTSSGSVSNITISGGTVTATRTYDAGIGSGSALYSSGSVSNITITGGSVKASNIGFGCQPTDGNGHNVSLYTFDNPGGKAVTIDGKSYPTAHTYYDGSAWKTEEKVYLYLTGAEQSIAVGNTTYVFLSGGLTKTGGKWGSITWKFTADGTLTFSGSGNILAGPATTDPYELWGNLYTLVKKVVIEDGVTGIESFLFVNFDDLASVEIADSVTTIDAVAFNECDNLANVFFFGDPTNLHKDSFVNCSADLKLWGYSDSSALQKYCQDEGIAFAALDGDCGDNVTWKLSADGTLTITGSGAMADYSATAAPWKILADNGLIKKVIIGENIAYESLGITASTMYTVTIKDGDDVIATYVFMLDGEKVPEPTTPTKTGYTFLGWHNGETKYDFSAAVTDDITLTAKWEKPDYAGTLESAQEKLDQAIKDLQDAVYKKEEVNEKIGDVNTAIGNLQKEITKINDPENGKADASALAAAVDKLNGAIETLNEIKDDYVKSGELKDQLDAVIGEAKGTLKDAEDRLSTLEGEMSGVQSDLDAVKKKADANGQAISDEESRRKQALGQAAQDLADAQGKLETAISNGDNDLLNKINDLNNALERAEAALQTTDAANKTELDQAISDARVALQMAIDRVASDLTSAKNELNVKDAKLAEKDAKQQTFIVVVCVIACVSLAGNIAIVAVAFILKRKQILH